VTARGWRAAAWSASVLWFALRAPLLLRGPLDAMARRLEPLRGTPPAPEATAERLIARLDRLLAAGRPLVRGACLTRGATAFRFLRGAGFPVVLRFGIRPIGDRPAAHCWLELDGEPLGERRDPRPLYLETFRVGGQPLAAPAPPPPREAPPAAGRPEAAA
jgi:hypothetical protein